MCHKLPMKSPLLDIRAEPLSSATQAESLLCANVSIEREGLLLINALDFSASPGEIWVIQGSNGSGKSTLLKAIAGLYPISFGTITLGAQHLLQHQNYPHNILFLGHKQALKLSMSVYDNVAFWAKLRNTEELIEAAISYFDLEPYRNMHCELLSAGWQQRVVLTRLLTMPSKLWLLDEPMTHLDNEGIALMQSLIISRTEQQGIVLMSSHAKIQSDKVKILNLNNLN